MPPHSCFRPRPHPILSMRGFGWIALALLMLGLAAPAHADFAPRFSNDWSVTQALEFTGTIINDGDEEGTYHIAVNFRRTGQPFHPIRNYNGKIYSDPPSYAYRFHHDAGPGHADHFPFLQSGVMRAVNDIGGLGEFMSNGTYEVTLYLTFQPYYVGHLPGSLAVLDTLTLPHLLDFGGPPTLPDLKPSAVVSSTTVLAGGQVTLTGRIINLGAAIPNARVHIRCLAGGVFTVLSNFTYANIPANSEVDLDRSVTIPGNTPPGLAYLAVIVDPLEAVTELREANNQQSITLSVGGSADLTETDPSLREWPLSARPGSSINTRAQIRNFSQTAAGAFQVNVLLSPTPSFTEASLSLGAFSIPGLASLGSAAPIAGRVIPADFPEGYYYPIWRIDSGNAVTENDETNNLIIFPEPVRITRLPNLRHAGLTVVATEAPAGGTLAVSGTRVIDANGASIGPVRMRVHLSFTDSIIPGSIVISTLNAGTLPSGHDPWSLNLTLPATLASGSYYLGVELDPTNTVTEAVESDNLVWTPGPIAILPQTFRPAITFIAVHQNDLSLSWTSRQGYRYQLQRTFDHPGDARAWVDIGTPVPGLRDSTWHQFPSAAPKASRAFYRLFETSIK